MSCLPLVCLLFTPGGWGGCICPHAWLSTLAALEILGQRGTVVSLDLTSPYHLLLAMSSWLCHRAPCPSLVPLPWACYRER